MPIDNLPLNTTTKKAQEILNLKNTLLSAASQATNILNEMQHETDFSSWAQITANFGFASDGNSSIGYGLVFALADPTTGVLNSAAVQNFTGRIN